ncbi:MAG: 3-hydroxyacyl-CoA dehydrogenase/enoyl-CoA hydratase family protein [Spirochaetes bacterium]|nr:3-hydroxyacyl-CoA dehydrogenase/enoyl-CoA hydratase family protein [Spirochaetota bacterium]
MVRRIEKAAVIGSGIMGGGIAALCASAGIPVVLLDIVPFDLKDDEKNKKEARNKIVKAGYDNIAKAKPAAYMNKKVDSQLIEIGNLEDDIDKLKDVDIIFEVVVENLKIKQELFTKLEKVRKPDTIIASNTSGLPLKAMAEGRSKEFKDHFVILHFFNPVRYMKLLELVPGDAKKEVVDFVFNWGEKVLGKGMVIGKDTPNFIGNRIGVEMIGEAFKLIEAGISNIPEVDAMFGPTFGIPKTAIFGLADLVGLDTISHLAKNSYELLKDDEYREIYNFPKFVGNMVDKKMLGAKTKDNGGFYKTEVDMKTWKKIKKVIDPKTLEFKEFDRKAVVPACATEAKAKKTLAEKQKTIYSGSEFAKKLVASMCIYSANRIPEIADTIVDIDNAMKWGYAWEAGPFETWDNIGVKESVAQWEKDGLKIPESVKKMVASGATSFYKIEKGKKMYYDLVAGGYKEIKLSANMLFLEPLKADKKEVKGNDSVSLIDIGDGVFCIEFHSKMNAINGPIVEFIGEVDEYIRANGIGLVIGNQAPGIPGAFSAGGDLAYMGGLAKEKKFSEIDSFIKNVHKTIMGTYYSPYPVVAAPYGMTLGGGAEVCLAANRIVAHCELFMGLVEIGAGLLPGGCGMINLWKNYMFSKPESANITDLAGFFIPAFMNVAQAKVSMSAMEARNNGFLTAEDRIIFNKDYLLGEAKKEVLRMIDDGFVAPTKRKIPVLGREAQGMVWANLSDMKNGGYITPHMEFIAKKMAVCMSGGDVPCGTLVTEEHLMTLEREAFVDLWKTENTQKMAAHILSTGKPLLI